MHDLKTVTFDASQYRKKPVTITAHQWFKNGDHPEDGSNLIGDGHDEPFMSEGKIVRRYRHPAVPGDSACEQCGKPHHDHGWVDTLEQGHRVCPGDWIIKGIAGEFYPCKPDIFAATYESAAAPTPAYASQWQPIETAPSGANGICWMFLTWGPEDDQTTGTGMRIGDQYFAAGSFFCHGGDKPFEFREIEVSPTHWMHLPSAPGTSPTPAAQSAGQEAVPLGAIENGRVYADRLEHYPFESQGGPMHLCSDWQEFRRCFEHLAQWAMENAAPVNGGERCSACGGNDGDMPCAFPEGGQPGCSRDVRLGRAADERQKCQDCYGKGFNDVDAQVSERESDVQTFRETCEACDGTGKVGERAADAPQVGGSLDMRSALQQALMALTGYLPAHRNAVIDAAIASAQAALSSPAKVGGDEREAFEHWASDEGAHPKAIERVSGCYKLAQIQSYWMAWQARAALSADGEDRKDAWTDGEFRDLVNKVTNTAKVFGQTQQLRERIRDDLECVRECRTDDALCAERYRILRDVPTDLLNAPGVPCIAVPIFGNKGTMYNGADADRVVDARIAASTAKGDA